jgi:hypothetical protein
MKKIAVLISIALVLLIFTAVFPSNIYSNPSNSYSVNSITTRTLTFEASGLPYNDNFTVHIDGKNYFSVGGNLTITGLSPENYNFTISVPPLYSSNITSESVNLTLHNQIVKFTVFPANSQVGYLVAISIVVTISILLVFTYVYVRRKNQ